MPVKTRKPQIDLKYAVSSYRKGQDSAGENSKLYNFDSIHMNRKSLNNGVTAAIFAIADGKGEYLKEAAESASHAATEECRHFFETHEFSETERMNDELLELFKTANMAVRKQEEKVSVEVGSTLTVSLFVENRFYIGHVGNCRVYHLSGNDFKQITVDQSLIIRPLDTPGGTVGTRRVITRQLGGEELSPPSYYRIDPEPGDLILMCSDGLSTALSDEDIAGTLSSGRDLETIGSQLADHAKLRNADDDVTTIVIKVTGEKGKKGIGSSVPVITEKSSRLLFTCIPLLILLLVVSILLKDYILNRQTVTSTGEPRFTLYSEATVLRFFHNMTDKTKFLKDNKGFVKLNNRVNRFDVEPDGMYNMEVTIDRALDVNIDFYGDNTINVDGTFIGITVGEGSRISIKRPKINEKTSDKTVIIIKNMKGSVQTNLLVPVNTTLKIK